MYSGNDIQAVQLLQGGGYLAVSSNTGAWTQPNPSSSGRKSSKGARGGSASKGLPVTLTPVGRQVAFIDANTGNLVAQSSAVQSFARAAAQQQSAGRAAQQTLSAQPQQAQAVVQVHTFQQNGQQQTQPQVLHSAPVGPQVYKLTNGTRVVKAGQPYPNTTIVQTAVAVPTGPQQSQPPPQQTSSVITLRPQGMQPPPPQQQQGLQQQQPQQQLSQQGQILQLQLGGAVQLTTSGTAQQQQQSQQQQAQQAKLTLLQQAPQSHVLVAQPQQQVPQQQVVHHPQQQQQQQLLQGKQQLQLQQRQSSAPAAFQAVAVRPVGAVGAGAGAAIRPSGGGPVTQQPAAVYATAPPAVTTVVRPAVRIPKLGTVATYNPVTGVRSATTTASGGVTIPLLPANLPATLVQQVQKANLLQQQQLQQLQQQQTAAAAAGGLKAVLQVQPKQQQHLQGQAVVRSMGTLSGLVAAGGGAVGGGGSQQRPQATLVVGGTGGGITAAAMQAQQTHMGMAVGGGGSLQQPAGPLLQSHPQLMHLSQGPMHVLAAAGGPQQSQQQQSQQQHQQVVNITLADGTTATTVMDQATLSRMFSESSRGQAVKLQQQQQQQQQRQQQQQQQGGAAGSNAIQGQLQAMQLQQQAQQMLLQAAPQLAGPGLFTVLAGSGSGAGGKGPSCLGGGLEQLGGNLQSVHLAAAAASAAAASGPAQLLIRSGSSNGAGGGGSSGHGGLPPPQQQQLGLSQGPQLRTVQIMTPSGSHGSLQLPLQPSQQHQADMLQQLQQQQSLEQQLQHQMSLGRRPSGHGLPSEVDPAAALMDPASMTLAQFQSLGTQRLQQQQQQQHMPSAVEGLSVVDLDGTVSQQQRQRLQQQQQGMVGSTGALPLRAQPGALGGFMAMQDDTAAMTAANFTLGASGADAATAVAGAANLGGAGGGGSGAGGIGLGGVGSSREDLKAILVSIGQELARHGISVETAVTSGWLGVLTAMDVAVLADAYTDEERRLMMHPNAQPQTQQQKQRSSQTGAQGGTLDGAPLPPGQVVGVPPQQQPLQTQGAGESGPLGTIGTDCRSGSSGERGSTVTAAMAALTSSSARTSMSVAPSDDGASTASGGGSHSVSADVLGVQQASGGGGSAGGPVFDLGKFNAFQYGFLGAGMLSALGGGDPSSELVRLPAGGSETDRDGDAAAMADVFGEKPWPPFGMSVMAEEIGLSAQPHLQSHRHHFPPPHASALLGGRTGSSSAGPKLIDSASEYEARHPLLQHQMQLRMGPGAGRLSSTAERQPLASTGGGGVGGFGGLGQHAAMSASSMGGGGSGGASKGYSSAPDGMFGSGAGGALDLDKEIENRFANLDLGCGFY